MRMNQKANHPISKMLTSRWVNCTWILFEGSQFPELNDLEIRRRRRR